MRSIQVEPSRLEITAENIEKADETYRYLCKSMYENIDKMSLSWTGKDNTMFVSQIKAFEDDLRQISLVMRQYADFLKRSARSYRQAQDSIYNNASKLRIM